MIDVCLMVLASSRYCGDEDPWKNDPSDADHWPAAREIHTGLTRWLCVKPEAQKVIDPKGKVNSTTSSKKTSSRHSRRYAALMTSATILSLHRGPPPSFSSGSLGARMSSA